MNDWLNRTRMLIGDEAVEIIKNSKVAVVGLGGVGGNCAEAVCRAGVENMLLIDYDTIDITNLNRQLFTTTDNIGAKKTDAAKERLSSINRNCKITILDAFYNRELEKELFSFSPDYVVDAIDTVASKLDLITACRQRDTKIISSMGMGNRLDPSLIKIGDIIQTAGTGCPLSRIMRRELKKRGITEQTVVYSSEIPRKITFSNDSNKRRCPASISFCPPAAGYIVASHVITSLIAVRD